MIIIIFESQKDYSDHRVENGLVDVGKLEAGNPVQEDGIIIKRSLGSLNKESGDGDRKRGMDLTGI